MYRTLDTLITDGIILVEEDADNKKVYSVTPLGKKILEQNLKSRKETVLFAEKILKGESL